MELNIKFKTKLDLCCRLNKSIEIKRKIGILSHCWNFQHEMIQKMLFKEIHLWTLILEQISKIKHTFHHAILRMSNVFFLQTFGFCIFKAIDKWIYSCRVKTYVLCSSIPHNTIVARPSSTADKNNSPRS